MGRLNSSVLISRGSSKKVDGRIAVRVLAIAALAVAVIAAVPGGTLRAAGQAARGPRISSTRLIDNERVTVTRLTFPAGVREQKHITPQDLVVIQATAGDVEVTLGDQTTRERVEAGRTWYVSKTTEHAYSNVGTEAFDLLVIFVK